jgi:hypothetical protein
VAVVGVAALALGACGGDDDDDSADSTTTTTSDVGVTTTVAAATTTAATTTTTTLPAEVEYVTEGAIVVVANASTVNGAAGRMSDQLEAVGYEMGTATNSTEGQLETSKVYFDPENPDAEPVAASLRLALGGGDIELLEMGTPAPVEDGDVGDATVLIAMGNDTADRTLDELQGRAPATDTADDGADDGTDDGDTTESSAPDSSTPDSSTPDTTG